MVKKFKVHVYGKSISINEDELEKAYQAQITGAVALLSSGSVRGSSITLIEPDYNYACGFNEGYTLNGADWAQAREATKDHKKLMSQVVDKLKSVDNKQNLLN